jgi:hypothetical protein
LLNEYIEDLHEVVAEYAGLETLLGSAIRHYTAVFSEDDLNELAEFFESPLGVRYVEEVPVISQLVREESVSHAPEMMSRIVALRGELLQRVR